MRLALVYQDEPRYFTVGSYIKRELAKQEDIDVVCHPRIPEDTGMLEEQCGNNLDLILVIDSSTHYKLHHHRGKLGKAKTCFWISDLHRSDWAKMRLTMIREWHYDHIFYAQKNFKQIVLDQGYKEHEISWLPHAADPEIFKPLPWISRRYDSGYIGFTNDKRDKFFNIVKQYVNFKHFNCVWGEFANRCMNELKICINIPVEDDTCNMRSFEAAMAGIPLLIQMKDKNGFDEVFNEDMYLAFEGESDLKEKLVRLIAGKEYRESIAQKARTHALMYHSYRNRINTILGVTGFPLLRNYA